MQPIANMEMLFVTPCAVTYSIMEYLSYMWKLEELDRVPYHTAAMLCNAAEEHKNFCINVSIMFQISRLVFIVIRTYSHAHCLFIST